MLGRDYLERLGAGAIVTSLNSISGGRPRLVNAVCRQKADATVGLLLLLLGMLFQLWAALARPATLAWSFRTGHLALTLVGTAAAVLLLGSLLARRCARRQIVAIILQRRLSQRTPAAWKVDWTSEQQRNLRWEMKEMLKGLASQKQLDTIYDQFLMATRPDPKT